MRGSSPRMTRARTSCISGARASRSMPRANPIGLLARPAEFAATPAGVSALGCWRDWHRLSITAHDGLVGRAHPRLRKVFDGAMSATSLRMLLRDPIRFVWRYALGWKEPEEADEPLTIDALAFGNLVHDALRCAVETLEEAGGFASASAAHIEDAIARAISDIAAQWELEQPVPPALIWRNTLAHSKELSLAALHCPLEKLPGQKSWTEIPLGTQRDGGVRTNAPWDSTKVVEIPGTGIRIQGQVDRLDLAEDLSCARVIDYKTGKLRGGMAEVVLDGGKELQRCLYAFAVKTLMGERIKVLAALLYPRAAEGEQALFPLADVDSVLAQLTTALTAARENIINGIAAPGCDANERFNQFRFALPASPSYLDRKGESARKGLGKAADIWELP
jgi:PD-(D/E)XK nuclease superfamily